MRFLLSARWLLLAMVLLFVPASSHAGILIRVGFAPPPLPVYEQPDCPQPGAMWTPGYWAYDQVQRGYYWIPGAWVPAPYPGALWTPGYWGWEGGRYFFHEGYWGRHVGPYGGVNYGFGYGGVGFAGGEWRGRDFRYNTYVMHVDRRYIHNTFDDRRRVGRGWVERDSHVAVSGGPGGIRHEPGAEERLAEHEEHQGRTPFQERHQDFAKNDRSSYANSNGGHPSHGSMDAQSSGSGSGNNGGGSSSGTGTGATTNGSGGGSTTHTGGVSGSTSHTQTNMSVQNNGGPPNKPVPCTTGYVNGVCGSGTTTGGHSSPGLPGGACPSGQVRGPSGCTGPKTGSTTSSGTGSSNHSPGQGGGQTTLPVPGHGGAQPMISHAIQGIAGVIALVQRVAGFALQPAALEQQHSQALDRETEQSGAPPS